ncbi:hypothetical protein GLOIN_2v1790377 [Rhizophagus irregularis DAOM 181602=DAOM 197198]|uniref:BAH domain-containing protein n=1 Tax=Rhizophagus irregularis (strain DAOM 181602 / DAOM 197198 / MUCL 43194) TaxID=747089 RepID=A0A2P4NZB7_RHIID|nr:hypothetical protein GLOIN_2v1790377 [Rhizophagus irregularis DAOM 181602=DAOM 197198]POG58448.1 hypothetical protein GLOIN_2v1790377 [Rhizophagus irregularis DAOM 181602=DAOM 197198]|eukprot:XP_025165314.1 hypothetical protein GLOIN_2v1790377 [Rhizophagus irregularis DAOM 181602=DAOM 197198]
MSSESDYLMSSESDKDYATFSLDDTDTSSEERLFVDAALAEDKLPSFDGDFAPYFQDLTTATLFCWIHKHNISTSAYEDLVDIIMRPEFNRDAYSKSILISLKKTPSTSRDSKMAYQLSISDIIWNVLNNPSLVKKMYFGPDVDSKIKSEYWHGTLWAESLLFGKEQLMISEAIVLNEGDQYRLRIQKVLDYNDLPGTFKRELGQNRSLSREVWLQDEPFLTITTSQISEKVTEDTLRITKILYKHHAHWHIRDATLSYQHPSEYVSIMQPPSSTMKVYKLFLDIYYDDFRTFRNVYHSLGGVYVQFGNMPAHQRKLLKNHFVLGFVPFGGNFNEFMLPFVSEMKEFEQGKLMKVNGKNSWVIAGCRTCTVSRESLTNLYQDIPATSRYHHTTDIQFKEISDESTTTRQNQLCIQYGLRAKPNILDRLLRERHLQTPQDVYHATARKIGRLLKLTCELFSQEGENDHHASFMMSDYLRLAMIMPFILNNFLKVSSLKENESKIIMQRIDTLRMSTVKNAIISCWVHVAKTMRMVFESKFTLDSYDELQKCLREEMIILPKVFPEFANLPNLHINVHLPMHAKTYVDKGADQRLSQPCRGFATMQSNFRNLLTNWYITEDKVSNEQELNEDIDDIGLNSALVYSQMGWYELATYTIEESDGIFSKVHLHIGDIVTIHKENNGECYAIIKGIFKYKGNNGKYYVFITIDWFDDTNRIHNVLKYKEKRVFELLLGDSLKFKKTD